ncbi:hypothetical protein L6393_004883 [Escherichia coli]|jgi:hypothetical protein|uniref:hypothetical protein n=1 Tax=Enterobacteriaceae TaxID=543 RepID=UPI00028EA8D1|nr:MULTISPECIES: hypothetical protein [Enterobacteriaceae]EER4144387.1 hypothetical protein [Escherichia coli O6]EES8446197.1 hypothetical protein [Escherichia coli O6:H34]EFB4145704.1 hypothetical protein [Escherichia coli O113]EHY1580264.1 hypothetical protein [Escherichia coli O8]EHY2137142.1 hypothetical protein [Escherichia coli O157]EIH5004204.1 hypothetical protein [Shigella boydii]HDQ6497579.1 hypothetical protein [Escherichia coli O117:H4]
MVTSKKDIICEYAQNSLNDVASFAKFVSYAEEFVQSNELFKNEESKESYQQIWFELEIINALALSEWESAGRPENWQTRWELAYKQDASHVMAELLNTLQ